MVRFRPVERRPEIRQAVPTGHRTKQRRLGWRPSGLSRKNADNQRGIVVDGKAPCRWGIPRMTSTRYLEARQRCQRRRGPLSVGGIPTQTTRFCLTDPRTSNRAASRLAMIQHRRLQLAVSRPWIVHGSSMGRPWAVHGPSMGRPWVMGYSFVSPPCQPGAARTPKGQVLVFGNPSDRTSLPLKQNTPHLKSRDSIGSVA
jgi:hypothetical protein